MSLDNLTALEMAALALSDHELKRLAPLKAMREARNVWVRAAAELGILTVLGAYSDSRKRPRLPPAPIAAPLTSPFLSTDQAAAYLGITRKALYHLVARNQLRPLPGGSPGRLRF